MRLIAFDPAAETEVSDTGYAILEYDEGSNPVLAESGVIRGGFHGFCSWIGDHYNRVEECDTVICEKFVLYNMAADITPTLTEGVVRFLFPDVVLQPSNILGVITDNHLRKMDLYTTEGHHNDRNSAVKHALYYLRSQRHTPTLRMLTK